MLSTKPTIKMKPKKVKESKAYLIKKCKLLEDTVLKLLEFISEEHMIPIETLNELYANWIVRKSR